MGLPLRYHYWSILLAVIIVACRQGKVSGEIVQGCIESRFNLSCPEMKVIQVTAVVLGDSYCFGTWCCITGSDCTHNSSVKHRTDVHRKCDNKHSCTVTAIKEQIPCGWRKKSDNNDFERIAYDCINDTRNVTMNNSTNGEPTEGDIDPNSESGFEPEIAQGCVGSQLSLRCEYMKVIEVIDVAVGDLNGVDNVCNISYSNCTNHANANHTMDVHRRCDDQRNCTVDVIQEEISCGALGLSQNDFEFITYKCLNDSQNNLTSTHETATDTHISSSTEAGAVTDKFNSHMLTIGIVIPCIIVLLVIILIAVVMYRRKQGAHMKTRLDPVAMAEVDNNCQNKHDICADETQGTSLHDDNDPQPLYSQIDESDSPRRSKKQIIYSEVELRGAIWKDGEKTSETKAAVVKSSMQLETGTVSKPSSPQDDGCQTVIENDLYGMADNCVKDTAVESPTRSLAGAVSKTPSPQDDECLTLIENDIYCH